MDLNDPILRQAIDLAPKPEQETMTLPPQMILAFVHAGVISKRQGFNWLFKYIEPTEFDDGKQRR